MTTTPCVADRVALITGAGRGIGRAIALMLGRAGVLLALTARTRSELDAVADEVLSTDGRRPAVHEMDLTLPDALVAGLDAIRANVPRIDILVNNAGIAESAPLGKTSLDLWQRHLAVNATAPFLLSRALIPGMVERSWGRVINIASVVGLAGAPYITAYATSKHALVGLTRALASETAGSGVTVTAICPGYVATDIVWNGARRIAEKTGKSFEDAVAAMASLNASGKLVEPDQVAAAVVDLCGDDAAARTGETLTLS